MKLPFFLNQKNSLKATAQLWNIIALGMATKSWWSNPNANWHEGGADILCHLFSLFTLREDADSLEDFFSTILNAYWLGAFTLGETAQIVDMSTLRKLVDAISHLINMAPVFTSQKIETSSRPTC